MNKMNDVIQPYIAPIIVPNNVPANAPFKPIFILYIKPVAAPLNVVFNTSNFPLYTNKNADILLMKNIILIYIYKTIIL